MEEQPSEDIIRIFAFAIELLFWPHELLPPVLKGASAERNWSRTLCVQRCQKQPDERLSALAVIAIRSLDYMTHWITNLRRIRLKRSALS